MKRRPFAPMTAKGALIRPEPAPSRSSVDAAGPVHRQLLTGVGTDNCAGSPPPRAAGLAAPSRMARFVALALEESFR